MEIMYTNDLSNNYFKNKKFIGFVGEITDLKVLIKNIEGLEFNKNKTVKSYIAKSEDYLKALGLKPSILDVKIGQLASTDLKLIKLIKAILLKPKLIILNNIEIGINDRIANRISRFIKTMNETFEIKFMVISKNPLYIAQTSKNILVMKNCIIKYQGSLMLALKQDMLEKPPIIKMIDIANKKAANLDYTLEDKELLKAIYRSIN